MIAAGGTLGIMIPPSTIMVIYGIVTETHIGKLFAAGVLPGLVCAADDDAARWPSSPGATRPPARPASAPRGATAWSRVRGIWGVALLFVLVLGGIYGGVFTATEGAGIGASGAFLFALARGALTPRVVFEVLVESARTTAMLFTILIAAMMFANFVNFTTHARRPEGLDPPPRPAAAGDRRRDDADLRAARHRRWKSCRWCC